jgi:mono/diheme cytochrome c family protein
MKQFFSGCALVLVLLALAVPTARASSRKQREHGAELFNANGCLHCHMMGKAGGNKGPNLAGVGRKVKSATMRKQIVEGGKGMPPFGNILEPQELDDLIAYLRSCRTKTPN